MRKRQFRFEPIAKGRNPLFRVTVEGSDGQVIGTVRDFYIRHMHRRGWEATGVDGAHLAVHEHRWQAALALTWNRQGVAPFPIAPSRRAEVIES